MNQIGPYYSPDPRKVIILRFAEDRVISQTIPPIIG